MDQPTPPNVFTRLLGSRKVWVAVAAVLGAALSAINLPADKATPLVTAIAILGAAVVGAIGYEDGKQKGREIVQPQEPPPAEPVNGTDRHGRSMMQLAVALVLPLALLGGCGSPTSAYVQADRATFEAVAPEYRAYVTVDGGLDAGQRARRIRTIDTWRLRLESAEKSGTPAPQTQPSP